MADENRWADKMRPHHIWFAAVLFVTSVRANSPAWPAGEALPDGVSIDAHVVDGWGRNPWFFSVDIEITNMSSKPVLILNVATIDSRYEWKKRDGSNESLRLQADQIRCPNVNAGITVGAHSSMTLHLEAKRLDVEKKPAMSAISFHLGLRYVLRSEGHFPQWPHGFEYTSTWAFKEDERFWEFDP